MIITSNLAWNFNWCAWLPSQRSRNQACTARGRTATSPTKNCTLATSSITVWTASSTWYPVQTVSCTTRKPVFARGLTRPRRRVVLQRVSDRWSPRRQSLCTGTGTTICDLYRSSLPVGSLILWNVRAELSDPRELKLQQEAKNKISQINTDPVSEQRESAERKAY